MTHKITSPQDLLKLKEQARKEIDLRSGAKDLRVTVHMGTCGIAAGARDVLAALMNELTASKSSNVSLQQTGCAGLCDQEPMITVTDQAGKSFRYGRLTKAKVGEIVREHLQRGMPVSEYLIKV